MKLPLNWLNIYINPKLSTEDLIERLTMAGLEVEGIEYLAGDTVLEIEVTPNRPDCLNILGLAREVGAITSKPVKYPKIKSIKTSLLKSCIHIEDKKDCTRYIATLIRDVVIEESPKGVKQCLASVGINAISNAVDITNFVLMESGQPLHAFDYDKLAGGKIIVRRAKAGEKIVTLDGIERKLDPTILVIADAQKPVAIAGIMGGRDTQITSNTKNILLESAYFEMGIIRRASRSLGLRSDSSYRFERNVNIDGVLSGADRATDLLLQLTGGKLAGRAEVFAKIKTVAVKINVKIGAIEELLGLPVTAAKAKAALLRLGLKVTGKADALTVVPPSNRADIKQDVDVIEEIARMTGFDHMPSSLPVIKAANIVVDKRPRELKTKIRKVLAASSVDEIITLSMINSKSVEKCNITQMPQVRVFNPLSQDQELMRPVLLPSFLQVVSTNINRGQKDLRFFEIGEIYSKENERESLGVLLTGRRSYDWRASKKELVEIYDLKGILDRIFEEADVHVNYESISIPTFDAGCGASITIDGKDIGIMGKVDKTVLNNWDIKNQDIYFAAFYLEEVLAKNKGLVRYAPISEFPTITRDVSLAVKKEIPYKRIENICVQQGGEILRNVQFIEQYLGDKIQAGYKGLVFSCQYQSLLRTLREEEVTAVHESILQSLAQELGAIRR